MRKAYNEIVKRTAEDKKMMSDIVHKKTAQEMAEEARKAVPFNEVLCAGCIKANSLLLSVLNAARNRLLTTTNKEHDDILDEIEKHLKELEVL